jgi:hypothetical protein
MASPAEDGNRFRWLAALRGTASQRGLLACLSGARKSRTAGIARTGW